MNAVLGFAQMIESGTAGKNVAEYAAIIRQSGGALLSLINDVLDIARIEGGKKELIFERVNPEEVIATVIGLLSLEATERSMSLRLIALDEPVFVEIDRRSYQQILTNLIGNAIKFTPAGSGKKVEIRLAFEGTSFTTTVLDEGRGVSPDFLKVIGTPFSREADSYTSDTGGAGLGLSIVRELARWCGGSVTFANRPEGGFRADVVLPRRTPQRDAAYAADRSGEDCPQAVSNLSHRA